MGVGNGESLEVAVVAVDGVIASVGDSILYKYNLNKHTLCS